MVGFTRAEDEAPFMPVDILSTEAHYFMGSDSQAGKERQDGAIA